MDRLTYFGIETSDLIPLQLKQSWRKLHGDEIGALLARSASASLVLKFMGVGLIFALQILLARVLGAESYGNYVYALTWMNFLTLLGKAGMDTASIRFVASYAGQKKWGWLRGFQKRTLQLVTTTSIAMGLLLAVGVLVVQNSIPTELFFAFIVAALLLPFNSLLEVVRGMLQGLKHVVLAQIPQFILFPLLFGAGVIMILVVGGQQPVSAGQAMGVNLASSLLVLILLFVIFKRKVPEPVKTVGPIYDYRYWLVTAFPLLVISGMHLVITQTDVIMIGFFLGTTDSGVYAIAARIANFVAFGLMSVNVIAAPLISQFHAQGRMADLQRMVTLAARGIFVFSLPAGFALIILGKLILGWFGTEFQSGYLPLLILVMGQFINSFAGSVGLLMTMTGNQFEAMIVFGASAALNVLLNVILIPVLGLPGAALATGTSIVMWNVVLVVRVNKHLGINSTVFKWVNKTMVAT